MNQTLKTILISVATTAIMLVSLALVIPAPETETLGSDTLNRMSGAVRNEKNALSTTSEEVLIANGGRQYARLTNDDASIVIYLGLGETAVVNEGIRLSSGQSYEITPANLYVGSITAVAVSGTPNLAIVEK